MNQVNISPLIKPNKLPKQSPVGLDGWFTLIIIGLFGTIIVNIITVITLLPLDFSTVNMFYFSILIICVLNEVGLSSIILLFIFKRNIVFRILFLIQTCILGICFFLIPSGSSFIPILARILWTVYLYRSERVKNTFIGLKSINQIMGESEISS